MTRLVFIASALFVVSALAEPNPAEVPVSRDTSVKWIANGYLKMNNELETRDLSKVDIVFLGDSITRHWMNNGQGLEFWNMSFANALNLGMGGDRTEHVLFRLKPKMEGGIGVFDPAQLQPKVIVLMIGTNNLFQHDAEQIIGGIKAVVVRLKELRPDARIILCSVLPSHKLDYNRDKVVPVNEAIQSMDGVLWLNLHPSFSKEDGLAKREELYKDGLHLNADGYKIWHAMLEAVGKDQAIMELQSQQGRKGE